MCIQISEINVLTKHMARTTLCVCLCERDLETWINRNFDLYREGRWVVCLSLPLGND